MPAFYVKVRVTDEERERLDEECERRGLDRSSLCRHYLFSDQPLPSPPVAGPPVKEPKPKTVAKISKPVGRGPIDRAIAKVNRDYDVPRKQVEPLVCAVVNEITA